VPDPAEDHLLKTILTLLTSVFLPFAGDTASARDAALATVERMRLDPEADLLSIAQAIAFGVASMQTLVHALKPDIDPLLLLKLNRSAASLSRTEARHRRIVNQPASRTSPTHRPSIRERGPIPGETVTQPNTAGEPHVTEPRAQLAPATGAPAKAVPAKAVPPQPTPSQPTPSQPTPSQPTVPPKAAAAAPATPSPSIAARLSIGNRSEKSLDDLLNWAAKFIDRKRDGATPSSLAALAREAKGTLRRSSLMSSVAHVPLLNAANPSGQAFKV
jgi:hypothetical protein